MGKLHLSGPSLADHGELLLAQALPTEIDRVRDYTITRACVHLAGSYPSASQLDGAAGFTALELLHNNLIDYISQTIADFSPLHWLWLLRRAPESIWSGRLSSTSGYDASLAEVLCLTARKTVPRKPLEKSSELAYKLRQLDIEAIAELVVLTKLLSDLHSTMRWSAKGSPVAFDHPIIGLLVFWPRAIPSNHLKEAVEAYDLSGDFQGCSGPDWFGMGTSVLNESASSDSWFSSDDSLMLVTAISERRIVQLPTKTFLPVRLWSHFGSIFEVSIRFLPIQVTLSRLKDLFNAGAELQQGDNAPLLLAIARVVHLVLTTPSGPNTNLLSVLRRGYFVSRFEDATSQDLHDEACAFAQAIFPDFQSPGTLEALLRLGTTVSAVPRPLKVGPPVVHQDSWFALDLFALSNRLYTEFEYTAKQGVFANLRAEHWEESVREAVDRTKWAPTGALRDLVGRTLRLAGSHITDVDALAAYGRRVILISCKSIPRRGSYEAGEHSVVRNASQAMEEYLQQWENVVEIIRHSPVGDNYNLDGFDISGVVVTPMPVFVASSKARCQVMPGLCAAASLAQLEHVLTEEGQV